MSIVTIVILLSLMEDMPILPEYSRANRRAAREKTIAHNRKVYHNLIGNGMWFDTPKADGTYRRWASGHHHAKAQQGRWETERLSGHRRFQKWSRDYYSSRKDEFARRRWEEELKEYFDS